MQGLEMFSRCCVFTFNMFCIYMENMQNILHMGCVFHFYPFSFWPIAVNDHFCKFSLVAFLYRLM
jgi:hypothetical protein